MEPNFIEKTEGKQGESDRLKLAALVQLNTGDTYIATGEGNTISAPILWLVLFRLRIFYGTLFDAFN